MPAKFRIEGTALDSQETGGLGPVAARSVQSQYQVVFLNLVEREKKLLFLRSFRGEVG